MAVQLAGLSTLKVKFGYGVENTAGTKPSSFKWLERCNNISGIDLPVETIDASSLEDEVSKYIAGRQDSGGEWTVTFNFTPEVQAQLEGMISDYNTGKSQSTPLQTWFEVYHPTMDKAFFVIAEPPQKLPMPEMGQNELLTMDVTFTIVEYKGLLDAVEPSPIDAVAVTGISLNKSSTSISVGNSETLEATIAPANATNQGVLWTTTDSSVATVDQNGKVTGVYAGSATIVATSKDGGKTDTCSVTVS